MEKQISLNDVLGQFNPYHSGKDADALKGALGVNTAKREAFSDLFTTIMDPEHEDVRNWDDARWQGLVCFAQDFNNFLRALDSYYKQEWRKKQRN